MSVAPQDPEIRLLGLPEVEAFLAYLERHMATNGVGDTPLFQPRSRSDPWRADEHRERMREAFSTDVGEKGWFRAWAAFDAEGAMVGHVDLRGRPEAYARHRALLGIGVAAAHRGTGLAGRLLATSIDWARDAAGLAWIDLTYIAGNDAARGLYDRHGFRELAVVDDLYRIDGESVTDVWMALRLAGARQRADQ